MESSRLFRLRLTFVLLIHNESLDVLTEFFRTREALIDVVTGQEVHLAAEHGLSELNLGAFDVIFDWLLSKHRFDLVKP